ncbi:MAG TPA: hypothetical protein VKX17_18140 [Planctomycetota bacterium]|nr:hypothetical protein [Planctomycetota bacterium]
MLKHPIILALTCVGGFASDVDFSKVGAAIKSLNGTISSTERIELWQKIERIGIHDVSDFFPGLDRKETVETALHAIWSSGSHLDDARLEKIRKIAKNEKGGNNWVAMAWAISIILDNENGFCEARTLLADKGQNPCGNLLNWIVVWCEDVDNQQSILNHTAADAFLSTLFERIIDHLKADPYDDTNRNLVVSLGKWPDSLRRFDQNRGLAMLGAFENFDFYMPATWESKWHLPIFASVKEITQSNSDSLKRKLDDLWKHGDSVDKQIYLYAFWASDAGKSEFVRRLVAGEKDDKKLAELDAKLAKIANFETKVTYMEISDLAFHRKTFSDRLAPPKRAGCENNK